MSEEDTGSRYYEASGVAGRSAGRNKERRVILRTVEVKEDKRGGKNINIKNKNVKRQKQKRRINKKKKNM